MALAERVRNKQLVAVMGSWLVDEEDVYLELGRRMMFPFLTTPYPSPDAIRALGAAAFTPRETHMQQTIRDIHLGEARQRRGEFTALVKFLLERDGAVHLECVQPPWLIDRLELSPLWIRQSTIEYGLHTSTPSYARFSVNEPFSLF